MPSILSTLVSVAALSTCVLGVDVHVYLKKGCDGPALVFRDLGPRVCAVPTHDNLTIQESIARNLTTVHSGQIKLNEKELDDDIPLSFVGWQQGPNNNTDGPLQCGHVVNTKTPTTAETCMSVPKEGFNAFSWVQKKDKPHNGDISPPGKRHNEIDHDLIHIDLNIPRCTERRYAELLLIEGIEYSLLNLEAARLALLLNLAVEGNAVPSEFDDLKLN